MTRAPNNGNMENEVISACELIKVCKKLVSNAKIRTIWSKNEDQHQRPKLCQNSFNIFADKNRTMTSTCYYLFFD